MTQKRLEKLTHFIAANVMDEKEAQGVVQYLLSIGDGDWVLRLKDAMPIYRKKQESVVNRANKRAVKQGKLATLTPDEWLETLDFFDKRCAYCRKEFSYEHLEHFFPISDAKSPGTTAYNCIPACGYCNRHKGVTNVTAWLHQYKFEGMDTMKTEAQYIYKYLQARYQETIMSSDLNDHRDYRYLYRQPPQLTQEDFSKMREFLAE